MWGHGREDLLAPLRSDQCWSHSCARPARHCSTGQKGAKSVSMLQDKVRAPGGKSWVCSCPRANPTACLCTTCLTCKRCKDVTTSRHAGSKIHSYLRSGRRELGPPYCKLVDHHSVKEGQEEGLSMRGNASPLSARL